MNIVVLYTRLPGYFLSCLKHVVTRFPEARISCVVYKPSAEAPFKYTLPSGITIHYKEDIDNLTGFVSEKKPDLIYVTGWSDKLYKSVASKFVDTIPVVLGFDNPWKGNIRQKAGAVYGKLTLKKSFNRVWVPGVRQYEFARRLGFSHQQIITGLYCADMKALNDLPLSNGDQKTILFTGRMVAYKHPDWLVNAFTSLLSAGKFKDWQLLMLGSGPLTAPLKEKASSFNQIKFVEFVQPEEIPAWYSKASVFCLPSTDEHWGVVIQEAAAAGLPLLLSDSCGAADSFLIPGANGALFGSGDYDAFKTQLEKMMSLSSGSLKRMGITSRQLSTRITIDNWVDTLVSVLQ